MKKFLSLALCIGFIISTGCASTRDYSTRTKTVPPPIFADDFPNWVKMRAALTLMLVIDLLDKHNRPHHSLLTHVADSREGYATRENWLDACIDHLQEINTKITEYNDILTTLVSIIEQEINKLMSMYKKQEIDSHALEKESKRIEEKQNEIETLIALLHKEISKQKTVVVDARKGNNTRQADIIEYEITQMESRIAELHEESDKLASISLRISI